MIFICLRAEGSYVFPSLLDMHVHMHPNKGSIVCTPRYGAISMTCHVRTKAWGESMTRNCAT